MAAGVRRLPEERLAPLLRAYDRTIRAKRAQAALLLACMAIAVLVSARMAEIDPARLAANIDRFGSFFARIMRLEDGRPVWTDVAEWFWGARRWLVLLADTLLIAYVGTALGAVAGFAAAFLAAANVAPHPVVCFAVRRVLEFCRTVPELVFALIFVVAFGLGPVPGVLAIAIHTAGALGKQFYEVVENIDMRPVDGVSAAGATWTQTMRFAAVPQVMSNLVSYTLLRFEINVRGASVMGFVGAGGIGQDLVEAIRKFYYADVSALLLLIIATVMLIDLGTEKLRHRLLHLQEAR